MERNIIIELRGGLVTTVYSDDPMIEIDILDYDDLDSLDEEELADLQRVEAKTKGLAVIY